MREIDQPNLYELSGEQTEISYSTTSVTGMAQFRYKDAENDHVLAGDEIQRLETRIGQQITVTVESRPDSRTITATLLLPTLRPAGECIPFRTYVIVTTRCDDSGSGTSMTGPVQRYRAVELEGQARHVEF